MAFDFGEVLGDVKEKIEEVVEKLKGNTGLLEKFKSDPKGAVKEILKVDLPDGMLEKIVDGVKGKLSGDTITDAADKLKGLFGKKD